VRLSIIIPAFNEADSISQTLKETLVESNKIIKNTLINEVEVIVVNDGSTDNTLKKASYFKKFGVKIIDLKKNLGYGGALKTGFKNSQGDLIAFFDADGTYPINFLTSMCKKLFKEKADIVIGTRLGKQSRMPFHRLLGNKFFVLMLNFFSTQKIQDTASGMRVFKRKLLPKMFSLPNGLEFTPAMTAKLVHENSKIVEIPIPYSKRIGHSKLNSFQHGLKFFFTIINQVKLYNPLKLFGAIGLISMLAALYFLLPFFYLNPFPGFSQRRIMLILGFFIVGLNFIAFGFLTNFMVKLFYGKLDTAIVYKWAYNKYLLTTYNKLGIFLTVIGLTIIFLSFPPTIHWSISIIGLLLFLAGIQLILSSLMVRILKELFDKKFNEKNLK
jgi:glycosyltransferase involved in cell wall biosynthesis